MAKHGARARVKYKLAIINILVYLKRNSEGILTHSISLRGTQTQTNGNFLPLAHPPTTG